MTSKGKNPDQKQKTTAKEIKTPEVNAPSVDGTWSTGGFNDGPGMNDGSDFNNGSGWTRNAAGDTVVNSVNGKTGVVVLNAGDVDAYSKGESNDTFIAKAGPIPAATATKVGGIKPGAGLSVAADGTLNATGQTAPQWDSIQNKPTSFPPNIATQTVLGGVKPGNGLSIQADGTLDSVAAKPSWNDITGKPTAFPPNIASDITVGGIKGGPGAYISPDGTLTVQQEWDEIKNKPSTFNPPTASKVVIGGVKVGSGLNITSDGTLSTTQGNPDWSEITNKPTAFPPTIATKAALGGVKPGAGINIQADGTISVVASAPTWAEILDKPTSFNPNIASTTTLGGIKVGKNLTVSADGTLDATGGGGSGGVDPGVVGQIAYYEQNGALVKGTPWANLLNGTLQLGGGPVGKQHGGELILNSPQQSSFFGFTNQGGLDAIINMGGARPNKGDVLYVESVTDVRNVAGQFGPAANLIGPATTAKVGLVKPGVGVEVLPDGTLNVSGSGQSVDWNDIANKPASFPPPIATATVLGGVKQGAGIVIGPDGTISSQATAPTWDQVQNKPTAFPPVIATATVVGGVKQGANITIAADGTISATGGGGDIAPATPTVAGKVFGVTGADDGPLGKPNNVFLGVNVGGKVTTGRNNVAIGVKAADAMTTDIANVYIGNGAGQAANGSNQNTGVGYIALYALTTGLGNTAYGAYAGNSVKAGEKNTLIGYQSGTSVVGGSANTIVGAYGGSSDLSAAVVLADGNGKVRFGANGNGAWSPDFVNFGTAGQILSSQGNALPPKWIDASAGGSPAKPTVYGTVYGYSSQKNVTIGYNAGTGLSASDAGTGNVALGVEAGYSWNGATSNVAIGYQAMRDSGVTVATTGNVAIGSYAGKKIQSPNNVAIGNGAFGQMTMGLGIAIGYQAAKNVTTGQAIISVGQNSLAASTTANGATAVGYDALAVATAPENSTALGFRAGWTLTAGDLNTFIGYKSGAKITSGSRNTLIGGWEGPEGANNDGLVALSTGDGKVRFAADDGGAWSTDGKTYGTDGQILVSKGPGVPPVWNDASGNVPAATPVKLGVVYGSTVSKSLSPVTLGYQAGELLDLTGNVNNMVVAIGSRAAKALSGTGFNSVYVGCDAGLTQARGDKNTVLGKGAGGSPYAQDSIIIGYEAASGSTANASGQFDRNILIGNLNSQVLKGTDNIIIGHSTMRYQTALLTNATVIGGWGQNATPNNASGCVVLATPTGQVRQMFSSTGSMSFDGKEFVEGILYQSNGVTAPKFVSTMTATGEWWIKIPVLRNGDSFMIQASSAKESSAILRVTAANDTTGSTGIWEKAISCSTKYAKTTVVDIMPPVIPGFEAPCYISVDAGGKGMTIRFTGPTTVNAPSVVNAQLLVAGADVFQMEEPKVTWYRDGVEIAVDHEHHDEVSEKPKSKRGRKKAD